MPLVPLLWIGAGATATAALMAGSKLVDETGDAIEQTGDAAEQSVSFMDRVIVLTVIGGALYFGAKVLK
ncbi:hypothetical protein [Vibrio scophthalmi]|uniref:hypothetical protein n=1 Tax=Vibrio scophthalmi TaxID=45658 RepID=UPI003AAB5A62